MQKQKLNIQETSIGSYTIDVCTAFTRTAEVQGVNLKVNNYAQNEKLWIDRDSFDKLIFNLLSNSFKHTQIGRSIEVNISKKDSSIILQVKDEGSGMTKEILNKLFSRFNSFNTDKSKPSTGIGLSIVKEVVDKHHAKINVESDLSSGSCFTVIFPQGIEHFGDEVNIIYTELSKEASVESQDNDNVPLEKDEVLEENRKETILLVEDDSDLRQFIKTILLSIYDVIEASDGQEGFDKAYKYIPDFIVSDIMMPNMDGVQLLQKIRNTPETSHIPLILLTAKANMESKLDSLGYGADDYITKPFSVKYLKARIENIIQQRKRLYNRYSSDRNYVNDLVETIKEEHDSPKITDRDELFIQKAKEEVEKNIDNSDFLIENLVSSMAMSRTVFFKKLKSLTGLAPVEFIRDVKIKHAAKLIATQQYTIKEVSFMVGISDAKYFTQCFKKTMGMTPSEYKNRMI